MKRLAMFFSLFIVLSMSAVVPARADSAPSAAELFEDYTHTTVNKDWQDKEKLEEAYATCGGNKEARKNILRALAVLEGAVSPVDSSNVFSVADGSIKLTGDMRAHLIGDDLRYPKLGSNRQPTGCYIPETNTLKVFVEGLPEGANLKISFGQVLCSYSEAQVKDGGTLINGENQIYVPVFNAEPHPSDIEYTPQMANINLEFAETDAEAMKDVRVYLEDVKHFPVFHQGGDVEAYKKELNTYVDTLKHNKLLIPNITQIVSKHTIMTVRATRASEILSNPESNLERSLAAWDFMIDYLLDFDGVAEDDVARREGVKQEFITIQGWSGALMFASGSCVGVFPGAGEDGLIDCYYNASTGQYLDKPGLGWGYVHEVGHEMDIALRRIGENTNNMFANAYNTEINGLTKSPHYFEQVFQMGTTGLANNKKLLEVTGLNYVAFWNLEAYKPGFWGEYDNFLRNKELYTKEISSLTKSEQFAYISSYILNHDMTHWVSLCGTQFSPETKKFDEKSVSSQFRTLMEKLKSKEGYSTECLPLWFLDSDQWLLAKHHDGANSWESWGNTYNGHDVGPEVSLVYKDNNCRNVAIKNKLKDTLAVEIYVDSGNGEKKLLTTTREASFKDTNTYAAEPTYYVRGIDRKLVWSAMSEGVQASAGAPVIVNGIKYDTYEAAKSHFSGSGKYEVVFTGDTLITQTTLDGNVVMSAQGDVTLYGASSESHFYLENHATLRISSTDENHLTFAGSKLCDLGAAVRVLSGCSADISNVTFRDWVGGSMGLLSLDNGGTLTLTDCDITDVTTSAGAIDSRGTLTISGSRFEGCSSAATKNATGGAIHAQGGSLDISDSNFIDSASHTSGGAIWAKSMDSMKLSNVSLTGSVSNDGSGVYVKMRRNETLELSSVTTGESDGITIEVGILAFLDSSSEISGGIVVGDDAYVDGAKGWTANEVTISSPKHYWTQELVKNHKLGDRVTFSGVGVEAFNGNIRASIQDHDVTLKNMEGATLTKAFTSYNLGSITWLPTTLTKPGDTFLGWYDNEKLEGDPIWYIGKDVTGDVTYWAKWLHSAVAEHSWHPWNKKSEEILSISSGCGSSLTKLIKKTCDCGLSRIVEENVSGSSAHSFGEPTVTTTPATCEAEGLVVTVKCCVLCGYEETTREILPKLDHKLSSWEITEEATSETAGEKKRHCENEGCDYEEVETIPELSSSSSSSHSQNSSTDNTGATEDSKTPSSTPNQSNSSSPSQNQNTQGSGTGAPTGSAGSSPSGSSGGGAFGGGGGVSSGGGGASSGSSSPVTEPLAEAPVTEVAKEVTATSTIKEISESAGSTVSVEATEVDAKGNVKWEVDVKTHATSVKDAGKKALVGILTAVKAAHATKVSLVGSPSISIDFTESSASIEDFCAQCVEHLKATSGEVATMDASTGSVQELKLRIYGADGTSAVHTIDVKGASSASTDTDDTKDPTTSKTPSTSDSDTKTPTTQEASTITVYRLYNEWSGEHLFTKNFAEYQNLPSQGWKQEGVAWQAPGASETAVYRLYNEFTGDHHYTTDTNEYASLGANGWKQEGVAWYSDDAKGTPIYRLYNSYVEVGTHHYTTNANEYASLGANGWEQENVGWYGLK